MLGVAAYIVKYDFIYIVKLLIFGLAVTAESNINNFSTAYIYIYHI